MPHLLFVLIWVFVCASATPSFARQALPATLLDRAEAGPVRVLIRVNTDRPDISGRASAAAVSRARERMTAAQERIRAVLGAPSRSRRYSLLPYVAARLSRDELVRLAQHPDIVSIEPDLVARPALDESTSLVRVAPIWQYGYTGAGWSVAVLDTGVESAHPFFGGRVTRQACFSTTDPDEGATSVCPGGAESATGPGAGEPCASIIEECKHGTHVAGIAAGSSDRLSGVARGASIIAVQIFSRVDNPVADAQDAPCGAISPCALSFASDQLAAFNYVLEQAGTGNANRIAAVNLSVTFPTPLVAPCDSEPGVGPLKAAIEALRSIGIATIAAAGNEGATDGIDAPACLSSVVSVGATFDSSDTVAPFSNRSAFLSLMAPGVNIESSVPGGSAFEKMSGTSMAAPHVTGAWALFKELVPTASVDAILNALRGTAAPVADAFRAYPRIVLDRAALALHGGVPPPPGAPQNPTLLVSGNHVTLQWSPPVIGIADAYYVVAGTQPGAADAGIFGVGPATTISAIVGPGTYWVRVVGVNAGGPGPPSAEVSFTITPPPPPEAPTGLTAHVEDHTVTLTWTAPASGTAPTAYVIEAGSEPGQANLAIFDTGAPTMTMVVKGVPPGLYHVRVRGRTGAIAGAATPDLKVTVP